MCGAVLQWLPAGGPDGVGPARGRSGWSGLGLDALGLNEGFLSIGEPQAAKVKPALLFQSLRISRISGEGAAEDGLRFVEIALLEVSLEETGSNLLVAGIGGEVLFEFGDPCYFFGRSE